MKKIMLAVTLFCVLCSISLQGCVIFIGAPQIASFQSAPETVTAGDTANLIWAVMGADSVTITPDIGSVPLGGSRQIRPGQTTTYLLTARNASGSANASVVITVNPPPTPPVTAPLEILRFEAVPPTVIAGGTSTLQWDVMGAASVNISPDIGNVAPAGSRMVSPSSATTYTLTAVAGSQVVSRSVTVEMGQTPVVGGFTASPQHIDLGFSSLLTWNTAGADKVTIEPELGTVPASGTAYVFPNKTTVYVLTAQSACCVINRSVTVSVAQFPLPNYLPIIKLFNIYPNSIYAGAAATLQWDIDNADSVSIDQGIGPVGKTGSLLVTPNSSRVYKLTATNTFGIREVSIGITVFVP